MKKITFSFFVLALILTGCLSFKSLKSTTFIKANDAFILGNNVHGKFSVRINNPSNYEITIWQYPINGGKQSQIKITPFSTIKINVDKNIAIRIENQSNEEVAIKLKVSGDTGLTMGYKNK